MWKLTNTKIDYWRYWSVEVTDEPNMNIREYQHIYKEKCFWCCSKKMSVWLTQRKKQTCFYQEMPGIFSCLAFYVSRNWPIAHTTPLINIFRGPMVSMYMKFITTTPSCANANFLMRVSSSLITSSKLQLLLSEIKQTGKLWWRTETIQWNWSSILHPSCTVFFLSPRSGYVALQVQKYGALINT